MSTARRPLTAVILAAGYARRMRPHTDRAHKTLLPIGDATMLGRILDSLLDLGVDDTMIVTGYRAEDLQSFVQGHRAAKMVRYVHNSRYRETNNIVSLALAFEALDFSRDVALIESDLIFDPALLEALVMPGEDNLALVDRYRSGMDGTVVAVEDGLITQVLPPHLQGASFRYDDKFKTLNIYRFNRHFCRERFKPLLDCYANMIDGNAYYELVLGMLVNMQRERIRAVEVTVPWAELDDPNDLQNARFGFEKGARARLLENSAGGYWSLDVLDFHFLRNMHFPTDAMLAAMREALPQLARNYGSRQSVLDQKLAWHLLCDPRYVRALHGAAQVYPLLPELLGPRPTFVPRPTFGEYKRSFPDATLYEDTFGFDLDAVAKEVPAGGTLVVVNPNNPTGTLVRSRALFDLAKSRPDLLLLVDESFLDFAREPSLVEMLETEPLRNVLVLKSLSKTLGIPGVRLGYVYSRDEALLARLGEALPIWNLSAMGEFFLELSLKFRPELARSFVRTEADRADLVERLRASSVVAEVREGKGNFVTARLRGGKPAAARAMLEALLERHRIYVKDVSDRITHDPGPWLRLAVRLPEEHQRLVAAMESCADALEA